MNTQRPGTSHKSFISHLVTDKHHNTGLYTVPSNPDANNACRVLKNTRIWVILKSTTSQRCLCEREGQVCLISVVNVEIGDKLDKDITIFHRKTVNICVNLNSVYNNCLVD